jgi:hypothetical protein
VRSAPMSPREYREFAAQCLRWAARTKNDEHKSVMLKMMYYWTQTAEKLERAGEPCRAETESASLNDAGAKTRRPEHANPGEKWGK